MEAEESVIGYGGCAFWNVELGYYSILFNLRISICIKLRNIEL